MLFLEAPLHIVYHRQYIQGKEKLPGNETHFNSCVQLHIASSQWHLVLVDRLTEYSLNYTELTTLAIKAYVGKRK